MGKDAKPSADEKNGLFDEPEVLLAVVIADSYDKSLQPCTLDRSRVLVPLANQPLIDYTLAFLSIAGIEEVIVYCTSYPQQIKSHVESSKWSSCMKVKVIINEDALSMGDALRDLDDKKLISTDFVLVNGDLVANFDLQSCLKRHKDTRERDKDAILTKVMKICPPGHRIRSTDNKELYTINKTTNQILSHMKVGGASKVKLPTELIRENKALQLRNDLLDCHVTVCAAMVPSLLTDNFDYQTINDLIHGVLGNQEILSNTMHVDILEEGYAARASDLYTYKMVSREVMDKWCYPFCPDRPWASPQEKVSDVQFGNRYTVTSNRFSQSCELERNVVVGDGTSVGDKTVIENSVIGDRCRIGADVTITDSIIWDGCRLANGCVVVNSILCSGVNLLAGTQLLPNSTPNSSLPPQCILGKKVVLGPEAKITKPVMLISERPETKWEDDEQAEVYPEAGSEGVAYEFTPAEEEEEETDGEEDGGSLDGDQGDDELITPDTELFYNEVLDTLQRATAESISAENIILDINSLKHAYNIQINEVNHMVVQAVLDRPIEPTTTPSQLLTVLKPLLKLCLGVFKNYYRSERSQLECLQAIQEFMSEGSHDLHLPILCQVLMYLYQNDVLDEEVITSWHQKLSAGSLRSEVAKLVDWFDEADSESDG